MDDADHRDLHRHAPDPRARHTGRLDSGDRYGRQHHDRHPERATRVGLDLHDADHVPGPLLVDGRRPQLRCGRVPGASARPGGYRWGPALAAGSLGRLIGTLRFTELGEDSMAVVQHFDVIVIGTGAGGGTLAYRLAPSGKRILLIERGDYVPREKDNWSTKAVNLEGKYNTKEVWRDAQGGELHPHTNYWVGGNTKFYGAALFRLRREDFREIKHWGGLSPAWPISYEDLEPYYSQAEQLYQVHGRREEDPTDPPASAPYPHPPVSHEPRIQQLGVDLPRVGLKPFHVPLGVMLDERNPRASRCIRCGTCDGHPCLVYAKADAQVLCVDPALEHSNVTLLTRAYVSRLETSPSGHDVQRVIVEREGATEAYSADIVVVSAGAINSAALLLRSANDKHPRGLANGSDVVGRHYMGHVNSVLMALSKCPNPTVFQKTLALNDFYFGSPEWEYPMGHISFVGKLDGDTLKAGAPAIAPGWTLDLMARHSLDFWLTSEDLPDPSNRVSL